MRSIGAKFTIVIGAFAALSSGLILYRAWSSAKAYTEELTAKQAELALEFDLALRDYAAESVGALMNRLRGYPSTYHPESLDNIDRLDAWFRGFGIWAPLIFIAVWIVACLFFLRCSPLGQVPIAVVFCWSLWGYGPCWWSHLIVS